MENLTKEEAAYFESGGEAALPEEVTQNEETVVADAPVVESAPEPEETPEARADGEQPQAQDPAQDADDDAENEGDDPKDNRKVPYGAMKQEREKRKALEAKLNQVQDEQRQRDALVEQRLAMMQQAIMPQQAQPEPVVEEMPDPEKDLEAWIKWQHKKTIEREEADRQWAEYDQQQQEQARIQQEQEQQRGQVVSAYQRSVAEIAQTRPEIQDARGFLLQKRFDERVAAGEPPEKAKQNLAGDEFAFVLNALQNGANPAEAILNYAATQGFAPQAATPEPKPAAQSEQLDRVREGQELNKTLSGSGGSAAVGKMDGDTLSKMSEHEFDAWLEKNGEEGFRQMLGG